MTIAAARSRLFDSFAFHRRSSEEPLNTAARPPNLRSDRLLVVLCFGAIAIGILALTGYVLGNASISSLGGSGKPIPVVGALALIVLGAGLLALLGPAPAGVLMPRRAALAVIVIAGVDLLSAAFSPHIADWRVWGARGGVTVHAHPFGAFLFIALGAALFLITTRRDFAGHVIASAVLFICVVLSFAYVLSVPSFLDPRVLPVAVATLGLALISLAELLERPRGWVVPLLARTSAGMRSRLLLAAAIVVPFVALGLRALIADAPWYTREVGLTVIVVVNVFFSAWIVLALGVILHERESGRMLLASIVDSSADAIIGESCAGLIESWNAGAERMYGYTASEAIGRHLTMLAPPERRDELLPLAGRVCRSERVDPFETVFVAKDGHRIEAWLSPSPILDDDGNVVGVSTIAHDITDRKKAREVIRLQAEQYTTVLATSSDGFWLVDLEGRLLDVNDAYCRMSGYSHEELLGMTIRDINAIETPEDVASRIRGVVESGFARFETKHRTKDNRILDVDVSASLWRAAAGRMLVFTRDITQRKQELEALRSSEERLQIAQRAAGIGHFSWDIQTNITTQSDGMSALYGLPPDSHDDGYQNWRGRIFRDDMAAVNAEIQKSLTSGEFSCDFRVVWPDASIHWLHARGKVLFSDDGKPLRMVGVNMDITERKQTEEALRDSETALAEAQEMAHIGSWILYPESGEGRGSAEAFRIFAIDPAPVIPLQFILDRVHEDDRARVEAAVATSIHSGTLDIEARFITPSGTRVVHALARRRDGDEPRLSLVGTIQDVTDRREAEEAIRQRTESLERSNADLERFNRAAVGRELRMIELKQQINDLCAQLGQPPLHVLPEEHALAKETS